MIKKGPILIAEDDHEDQEVLKEVFTSLGIKNQLCFFENGKELLDYLLTTTEQPFLILSDVNLPGMNGHEVKAQINENVMLRVKSIPFIFNHHCRSHRFRKSVFADGARLLSKRKLYRRHYAAN